MRAEVLEQYGGTAEWHQGPSQQDCMLFSDQPQRHLWKCVGGDSLMQSGRSLSGNKVDHEYKEAIIMMNHRINTG